MVQIWMDGFDQYGVGADGAAAMLEGPWAALSQFTRITPESPSFGARTGTVCLEVDTLNGEFGRRVLGQSVATVVVGLALYLPAIPEADDRLSICSFLSAGTVTQGTLFIQSDGSVTLRGATGSTFSLATVLGSTTGPVLQAGTWHHIEILFTSDAVAGVCEMRVDEVEVLNLTGLNTEGTQINQLLFGVPERGGASVDQPNNYYYDDIVVRDTTGAVNNGFEGDLRVALLQPIANGVNQGWSIRSVRNLGNGVADFTARPTERDTAIVYPDSAVFEVGSGDFCIEGFFRWDTLLTTTQTATLLSRYWETGDQRSWRLIINGPDAGASLEFQVSTDGTFATVSTIIEFPFVPETKRWYHLAVTRESGVTRMFIDGQQVSIDQPDVNFYFNGTAPFLVNGIPTTSGASALDDSGMDGWADAIRFTVGAARYTANFTPPSEPLPTDVGGDPLYASVQLLLNFDTLTTTDQSANAFEGTLANDAAIIAPDDEQAYQNVDGASPDDSDFIEAAFVPAQGTLTFTANALDTEQVVIGATTYTLQAVLVDAPNNVLIGATATDTLNNLRAAVNFEAGEGVTYGTGTVQNVAASVTSLPDDQLLAIARTPGAAGNSIATTTTVTGASWTNATLLGGADIPGDSEFTISSLPPEVTGIRAVALLGRLFKTDSGAATVQMSFVEAGGASAAGADRPVTTAPRYYEDTFETDPNTMGPITPSTLQNARVRVNRTT